MREREKEEIFLECATCSDSKSTRIRGFSLTTGSTSSSTSALASWPPSRIAQSNNFAVRYWPEEISAPKQAAIARLHTCARERAKTAFVSSKRRVMTCRFRAHARKNYFPACQYIIEVHAWLIIPFCLRNVRFRHTSVTFITIASVLRYLSRIMEIYSW